MCVGMHGYIYIYIPKGDKELSVFESSILSTTHAMLDYIQLVSDTEGIVRYIVLYSIFAAYC